MIGYKFYFHKLNNLLKLFQISETYITSKKKLERQANIIVHMLTFFFIIILNGLIFDLAIAM